MRFIGFKIAWCTLKYKFSTFKTFQTLNYKYKGSINSLVFSYKWYGITKTVSIIRFAGYLYNRHAEIDHEFNFIKLHLNNRNKKCIRMQEKQSIKAQNKTSRIIPYKLCLLECCHRRADENNTNSAYFSSWSINHRFFRWQKSYPQHDYFWRHHC